MSGFSRDTSGWATLNGRSLQAWIELAGVPLPAYFYDVDAIREGAASLINGFGAQPHLVTYAVKANSSGTIVRALESLGIGADVVSGGECLFAGECGVSADRIVMSGVAKADWEIDLAINEAILAIQAESVEELERIVARAGNLRKTARVALRINPNVQIESHAHVATGHDKAKFGISLSDIPRAFAFIDTHPQRIRCVGISTHVGSMLKKPYSYLESAGKVCDVAAARRGQGHALEYVNFGGGFGIDYGGSAAAPPSDFARAATSLLQERGLQNLTLLVEPGRSLVGPHGVLVAKVIQSKVSGDNHWLMVNAGMNDLLRPALYQAPHRIEALGPERGDLTWRVVGPVCESTDDFGNHSLGQSAPECVVFRDAGAYAYCMASEYNGRPLASEVFLAGGKVVSTRPAASAVDWARRRASA